jgi:hypothetical protein
MRSFVGVLAACALGLAAGAMLAEGAVLVPWWRSLPAESFLRWYADNGARLFAFFGPLEIASAGLAVAAGVLYGRERRGARRFFVCAAVLAVAVLGLFPVYFQEVNASFETGSIPLDRVPGELARWAVWHWGRTAIGLAAFASAVLGVRAAARADVR